MIKVIEKGLLNVPLMFIKMILLRKVEERCAQAQTLDHFSPAPRQTNSPPQSQASTLYYSLVSPYQPFRKHLFRTLCS